MGSTDYGNYTITGTTVTASPYITTTYLYDPYPDAPLNVRQTEVEKLRNRVNAVRVKLVA